MDSVDVGEAPADFLAAATFDGARHGFVFRVGEHGIGYYRGGATQKAQQPQSQQSIPPLMPPPPSRPPPPLPPPLAPPRPPAAQPAADEPEQPATSSFWQQLNDFTSELDGGDTPSAVPKPIPDHGSPRAQSPPARLPSPGSTETIRWRPHRRRTQQHSQRVPYTWPTAPRVTLVAQETQAQAQVQAQVRAQAQAQVQGVQAQVQVQVQRPPASELQVSAMLTKWTEGTVPGSHEWIEALRAHAHPPTGWSAAWTNL